MCIHIYKEVIKGAKFRADLCFDVYVSPDIKDVKRKERGDGSVSQWIKAPNSN